MKKLVLVFVAFIFLINTTFASINVNINRTYELEKRYDFLIKEICEKYEIDVNLVKAVIRVESAFEKNAISINGSSKGLMQLTRGTAKRFGVRNIFDPRENIEGGVKYLKFLTSLFGNDLKKVLASYNLGEGRVYNKPIPEKGKAYANLVLACKEKYDKRDGLA
jgi:soluble lytic murein transglycosylase-like protein